jgi:glutathione S-transferase
VLLIHWKGGVHTPRRLPRRRRGESRWHTPKDIVEAARVVGVSNRTLRLAIEHGYIAAERLIACGPWVLNNRLSIAKPLLACLNAYGSEDPPRRYLHRHRQFSIYQSHSEMGHYEDVLCLFAKRLERGRFVWPQASEGAVSLR